MRQLLRSVDTDGDGVIEYSEFVAMFGGLKEKPKIAGTDALESKGGGGAAAASASASEPWMDEFLKGMGAAMQRAKRPLQDLFRKFDRDDDGTITYDEFYETLLDMQCPLSKNEMEQIAMLVDSDKNGTIDIAEFAAGFHITSPGALANGGWEKRVKDQLLRIFYHNKASLLHVFHSYDQDSSSWLTEDQFVAGVNALLSVEDDRLQIDDDTLEKLAKSLADEKGRIDYGAFVESFTVARV